MSQDSPPARVGRRTFVTGLAAAGAALVGGTAVSATATQTESGSGPTVAWERNYSGEAYDVHLTAATQTADGGYALAGTGAPAGSDGAQYGMVKAAADGSTEWVAFADDDDPETNDVSLCDVVQTADGGFVIVGYATNPTNGGDDRVGGKVAEAVKVTAGGDVSWVVQHDAFEDDESADLDSGNSDNSLFLTATATDDGGFLAGGSFEGSAWLAKLDGSGSIAWERQYDGFSVEWVRPRNGGYHAAVDADDTCAGLVLDSAGEVRQRVALDIDYGATPYNHEFALTDDGGYAYTGRDEGREDMVLGKLDSSGARIWRAEFDGPAGDTDFGRHVLETGDGGYAVAGYMSVDTAAEYAPTVVRTDGDGTEQWRYLFAESEADGVADVLQTEDGGYAVLLASGTNTLAKLTAGTDTEETATQEPTETATQESTETATEEPTETTQEPTETQTQEPTETRTREPTDTATRTPEQTATDAPTDASGGTPGDASTETATRRTATDAPTDSGSDAGDDDSFRCML
ncbi:hypothetical protein [Haloarcula nitratireducens]|uniref:Uncharacterized protein n=1 Tax=Haloarcula nitratireducens TaxID=2487749 RepID=A0AAW4PDV9_9EURY|nr:hypothetical protein [Halomicroarcula nitratireducens]MBX0295768.1 hypothetical protein [Halomicroarcula nitratireducens]